MKKEMEKLKSIRNDIKSKIERSPASEEVKQLQGELESLEAQVTAIFEDFTRIREYIYIVSYTSFLFLIN